MIFFFLGDDLVKAHVVTLRNETLTFPIFLKHNKDILLLCLIELFTYVSRITVFSLFFFCELSCFSVRSSMQVKRVFLCLPSVYATHIFLSPTTRSWVLFPGATQGKVFMWWASVFRVPSCGSQLAFEPFVFHTGNVAFSFSLLFCHATANICSKCPRKYDTAFFITVRFYRFTRRENLLNPQNTGKLSGNGIF